MKNIEKWRSLLTVDLGKSIGDDDFMAICPCHSDDKASLRVHIGKKGDVVMHCFVCAAKGVDVSRKLGIPINWLEPDAESDGQQACKDGERGCSDMELEEILRMAADKVIARAKIASKGIEKGECVIADVIAETAFSAFKRMVADHYSAMRSRGRLGADGKPVSDRVAIEVAKEVSKRDF